MAAYLIANVQITNAAEFEEYRRRVPAVIAAYGGRYLARGGTIEEFETGANPHRVVCSSFRTWVSSRHSTTHPSTGR